MFSVRQYLLVTHCEGWRFISIPISQSTKILLNIFSEHRSPGWNFLCLLVSSVAVKKSKAICDPSYAICFYFFPLWKQGLEISQWSLSAYFQPFAKCLVGLFNLETLGPGTFSSIIFLRFPNLFFSVLFPLNSSYSDVYPPWTVNTFFPLFTCFTSFFLKFFFFFFLMWTIFFKSLLNLLQYCFCFMFWFFGCQACGIFTPQPGTEPAPPALEGEVFTTGRPGKSRVSPLLILLFLEKFLYFIFEFHYHLYPVVQ